MTGLIDDYAARIAEEAIESIEWSTIRERLNEWADLDVTQAELSRMQEAVYDALQRIEISFKES